MTPEDLMKYEETKLRIANELYQLTNSHEDKFGTDYLSNMRPNAHRVDEDAVLAVEGKLEVEQYYTPEQIEQLKVDAWRSETEL